MKGCVFIFLCCPVCFVKEPAVVACITSFPCGSVAVHVRKAIIFTLGGVFSPCLRVMAPESCVLKLGTLSCDDRNDCSAFTNYRPINFNHPSWSLHASIVTYIVRLMHFDDSCFYLPSVLDHVNVTPWTAQVTLTVPVPIRTATATWRARKIPRSKQA